MRRIIKVLGIAIATILLLILLVAAIFYFKSRAASKQMTDKLGAEAQVLVVDGLSFRDLNKNGVLDTYEDTRIGHQDRVDDLLQQMSLEEKVGCMFISMIGIKPSGEPMEGPILSSNPMDMMMSLMLPSNSEMIVGKHMNSFNILSAIPPERLAEYQNTIQKWAERTRLGIPITLASDPRHGIENNPGTAIFSPHFSRWPGFLGLAATGDTALVREFGEIARAEYTACGIRLALHPMLDLATDPRWGRTSGTFGEDADLAAQMARAYILGFQGDSLDHQSVACMSKHWPGSGTNRHGHETHFPYGKEVHYDGENFPYHVQAFKKGAIDAGTAQMMTSYGIAAGQSPEEVAVAFNHDLVQGLLRDSLNFSGVICTDWNVIADSKMAQMVKGGASAWGVENLTPKERLAKSILAGVDQFGGEHIPELLLELVHEGSIAEDRINESVSRILLDKFRLGLFDDPYVDPAHARQVTASKEFIERGRAAQVRSLVLLKNEGLLPLAAGTKIFWDGAKRPSNIGNAVIVDDLKDADVIIKRISAPFEPKSDYLIESFMRLGRLYYTDQEQSAILRDMDLRPTVVVVNLDRPAILDKINSKAAAVFGEFGSSDEVILEMLMGVHQPSARLPFEMPSTWEGVEGQRSDMPYDSENPLYPFGHGLTY